MSAAAKRHEMERLLASDTRYALVSRSWWLQREDPERPILTALVAAFRPVRSYGSLMILERGSDRGERALCQRVLFRRPGPNDERRLREWIARRPDEPLPWELLGRIQLAAGRWDEAASALDTANRLDPENPRPLELLTGSR
jgi:cytochrome c-type biogenesis protein CcmH/NrfG